MTPDWFADAACRDLTNLFYPSDNERRPAREKRQQAALAICAGCPVLDRCAAQVAIEQRRNPDALSGIWAGTVYHDRAERTRQRSQTGRSTAKQRADKAEYARRNRARLKAELAAARAARKDVA